MISQTLDGRYVDKEKLVKLLKELFGAGNFQVKVRGFVSERESFESPTLIERFNHRTWTTSTLSFRCLGHLLM